METNNGMKEVFFDEYCKTFYYEKTKESDSPCCDCLDEPANQYSHKPVKYEEVVKKVRREV